MSAETVFSSVRSMKKSIDQHRLEIVIGDLGGRLVVLTQEDGTKIEFKFKELVDHLKTLSRDAFLGSFEEDKKALVQRNTRHIALSLAYLHYNGEVALNESFLHQRILTALWRLVGNFGRTPHPEELGRIMEFEHLDFIDSPFALASTAKTALEITRKDIEGPFQLVQTVSPGNLPASIAFSPDNSLAGIPYQMGTAIYRVNFTNGQFSLLGLVPGQGSNSLAFSPDGTLAAISSGFTPSNVTFYTVDSSGIFTPIASFPKTGQNFASFISFSSDGLLAAVVFSGTAPAVTVFAVNSATRSVKPLVSFSIGKNPSPVTFSPDSQLALITTGNLKTDPGRISAYRVDTSTGMFSLLGHYSAGQYPGYAAFSPSGRTVALSNYGSSDISLFKVDIKSGTLMLVQTIDAGDGAGELSYSPDGSLMAVVNILSNTVTVYSVAADGALKIIQTANAGSGPRAIAFSPQGQLAGVINLNSNNAFIYSVSDGKMALKSQFIESVAIHKASQETLVKSASGPFSLEQKVATGQGPTCVAISKSNTIATVSNFLDGTVTVYRMNGGQFALIQTVKTGLSPRTVGLSPSGTLALVTAGESILDVYSINSQGGFSHIQTVQTTNGYPQSVAFYPNGQFATVTYGMLSAIVVYGINSSTGLLSPIQTIGTGQGPGPIAVSPNGKIAVVANRGANSITIFKINPTTGMLTQWQVINLGQQKPSSVSFHPSSQFAAVTNNKSVTIYSIDDNGTFSLIQTVNQNLAVPVSIAFSPDGILAAVANSGANAITVFGVDAQTGIFTPIQIAASGRSPYSIAFGYSGQLASVVNLEDNNLSVFRVKDII